MIHNPQIKFAFACLRSPMPLIVEMGFKIFMDFRLELMTNLPFLGKLRKYYTMCMCDGRSQDKEIHALYGSYCEHLLEPYIPLGRWRASGDLSGDVRAIQYHIITLKNEYGKQNM